MRCLHLLLFTVGFLLLLSSDGWSDNVTSEKFGQTPDGKDVILYTLTNKIGASVSIMNYGATVVRLKVPDNKGSIDDVVLGFDSFDPYPTKSPYFGAIVGRYGNRIAKGKFTLDGKDYSLAVNNGPNSLHGGLQGFDKRIWEAQSGKGSSASLQLKLLSKDGEEGYPGNLNVTVTYTWTDKNELNIEYHATTDKATVLNLTNHTYFNLAGGRDVTILNHRLMLNAKTYTPVDSTLIPTGEIESVKGTPWDFESSHPIGDRLKETGGTPIGYDHNYVLNKKADTKRSLVAIVSEPITGRIMTVYTDQPGVQFYSGNFLDSTIIGKGGRTYPQYGAFCLETQHFPDSPNHPQFPTTELKPSHAYSSTTTYVFSTK